MKENYKDLFLLKKNLIFLNHGSFGSCPKIVFKAYQDWQLKLENQPVAFLDQSRDFIKHMKNVRLILSKELNVQANDLVGVMNATAGLNAVAQSISLKEDPYEEEHIISSDDNDNEQSEQQSDDIPPPPQIDIQIKHNSNGHPKGSFTPTIIVEDVAAHSPADHNYNFNRANKNKVNDNKNIMNKFASQMKYRFKHFASEGKSYEMFEVLLDGFLWFFPFYVVWLELNVMLIRFANIVGGIKGILDDAMTFIYMIGIIVISIQIQIEEDLFSDQRILSFGIGMLICYTVSLLLHVFYYYEIE